MRKKHVGIAALLAATMLAAPASAKTFVFCSEGSPEGFNPIFYTAGTTFDASSRPMFNRLVEFEIGTTKIVPGLAEAWDISDDGLQYVFKLRRGVKFHTTRNFTPTRDLNADDVIWSFERQWKAEHPYHKVSNLSYEYFSSMSMAKLLKEIVKVDDYTVKFVLNRPEAPFLANLGMDFASIFSKEYADAMLKAGTPEKFDQEVIGTGPFQFVAYQKDAVIRYKAFDQHWNGRPKIDDLVYAITKDKSVAFQRLKNGECHLVPYPNPSDIPAAKADPNLQVIQQPGMNIAYVGYQVEKKPFDNPKVRKALNMAINKDAIIASVYENGVGVKAKNPIPPSILGYNDQIQDDPYDPEAAKKLLAEAGFPNGFETTFWYMPVARPYNPNGKRMGEVIQADWAKIGVKVNLVTYEWAEYLKRTKEGDQDIFQLGWTGDNGDPDNFLAVLLGCDAVGSANRARWCHKPFDDLIQKAKSISDPNERAKLYAQAQVIFKDQAPWATIGHSIVTKFMRKGVTGFKISPFGAHVFSQVDITN